jgi:segregation and condensation protein A
MLRRAAGSTGTGPGILTLVEVPYEVQTPVFEGPFDLLLHLIMREQVDLYEIPLARIVDAYLAELERLSGGNLDLDVATEFLLIAATLVELKARRLLPDLDDGDVDEELALWEERDLLLARLLEAKTFKDAAAALATLAEGADRSLPRRAGLEERFHSLAPDLLAGVTPADLKRAFLRAVAPRPVPTVDTSHLHVSAASVDDAVAELVDELPRAGAIGFRRLTAALVDRLDVVVRFLAVLELFKQGLVELDQADAFGDITVSWIGGEVDGDGPNGLVLSAVDVYDG